MNRISYKKNLWLLFFKERGVFFIFSTIVLVVYSFFDFDIGIFLIGLLILSLVIVLHRTDSEGLTANMARFYFILGFFGVSIINYTVFTPVNKEPITIKNLPFTYKKQDNILKFYVFDPKTKEVLYVVSDDDISVIKKDTVDIKIEYYNTKLSQSPTKKISIIK